MGERANFAMAVERGARAGADEVLNLALKLESGTGQVPRSSVVAHLDELARRVEKRAREGGLQALEEVGDDPQLRECECSRPRLLDAEDALLCNRCGYAREPGS